MDSKTTQWEKTRLFLYAEEPNAGHFEPKLLNIYSLIKGEITEN